MEPPARSGNAFPVVGNGSLFGGIRARRAVVALLATPWLQACVEAEGPARFGPVAGPQARAEQALYAEIAQALAQGIDPVQMPGDDQGRGEDAGDAGSDGADAGDAGGGAGTDGGADAGDAGGGDGAGDGADAGDGDGGDGAGGAGSCAGACGSPSGDCWCDDQCSANGDCCSDYASACGGAGDGGAGDGGAGEDGAGDDGAAGDEGGGSSCAGACGEVSGDGCWCDDQCAQNGDCCEDYFEVCGTGIEAGPIGELAIAPPTRDASLSCLASWTGASAAKFAATGVLVGEAISKSCEAGGVIVGVYTAGAGFAAATVCLAGDVTQADAALGGIVFGVFGALKGLIDGIRECDGEEFTQAEEALGTVLEKRGGTDRVFVAPVSAGMSEAGTCNPCPPVPSEAEQPEPDRVDCVPPSIPHGECTSHHVHIYGWKTEQNPQDCVCRYKADETYLCYDPVADPDFAKNPIWDQCL